MCISVALLFHRNDVEPPMCRYVFLACPIRTLETHGNVTFVSPYTSASWGRRTSQSCPPCPHSATFRPRREFVLSRHAPHSDCPFPSHSLFAPERRLCPLTAVISLVVFLGNHAVVNNHILWVPDGYCAHPLKPLSPQFR